MNLSYSLAFLVEKMLRKYKLLLPKIFNFSQKSNLCHSMPKGLLSKGLLPKGFLLKGLPLKKCLKDMQTFFKRKPVPFAAEGPPGEGPPVEGPPVEGPPSGEMFERYSNLLQKKTCAICCRRASCWRASCWRASFLRNVWKIFKLFWKENLCHLLPKGLL